MWFHLSFWMIAAGIVGGLCAALFGFIDWVGIPGGTRAARVGLLHGGTNLVVVLLFVASWYTRRSTAEIPSNGALVLSFLGAACALIGGWLGGELVDRLGVGVDEGANLNAPSSLSGRIPMSPPAATTTDFPVRKAS